MSASAAHGLVDPPAESGRRQRLEELFAAHGRSVYGFARRRASAADADEIVSETFLVAWRRLDDVPANPLPWLLNVAHKSLANQRRGEARQAALRLRLASTPGARPDDPAGGDGIADEAVRRALATLSPGERNALTLIAWEGLSPDEVATVLGCSRAAVYLRIHRGRRRFARHWNGNPAEPDQGATDAND